MLYTVVPMIAVGRLAPKDQWDQTLLDDLFSDRIFPTGLDFQRVEGYPNTEGCCLIVPARYWHQHTDQISEAIQRYDWCLAFRVGDEEDLFRIEDVEHHNLRWWVQTPRRVYPHARGVRAFGVGYTPHMRDLPTDPPIKDLDVVLSAQRTHTRRQQAFEALERSDHNNLVEPTEGFTQGMPPAEYAAAMRRAKVAPAPSGAISVDSFRFWEALEAGAVPIVDTVSPVDGETNYWQRLFGTEPLPFPVYKDAAELPALITQTLSDYPAINNRVTAWYARYKRRLTLNLREDLREIGAIR